MKVSSSANKNDLTLSYLFLIMISGLSYLIPTQYDAVLTLFLVVSYYYATIGWDGIRARHNDYAWKLANMSPLMQLLGIPLLLVHTFFCLTFLAINETGAATIGVCLVTHILGYFVDNDSFSENENRTVIVFFVAPFFVITLNLFLSVVRSARFVPDRI